MRIRKNARMLVGESCSANKPPLSICELNGSPWDDESFVSQFAADEGNNSLPLNGNLAHSNHTSDRKSNPTEDSMELTSEYIEKREVSPAAVIVAKLEEEEVSQIEGAVETKTTSLNNPDDHGVKLVRRPSPQPPLVPAVLPPKKRGRPKKPTKAVAAVKDGGGGGGCGGGNNPDGLHYYSGFGQRNNNKKKNGYDDGNGGRTTSSSTMSQIMSEDNNDGDATEIDDNIDDVFYDDDDDDENGGVYGVDGVRIRRRRPIKTRSLKSLMR